MRSITGRVSGAASMQIGPGADGESDGDGGECVEVPFLSVAARDPADTGEYMAPSIGEFHSMASFIRHSNKKVRITTVIFSLLYGLTTHNLN